MKYGIFALVLTMMILLCACGSPQSGPYAGQNPPGLSPELFAPGMVSTGYYERDVTFSPDAREFFFGFMGSSYVTILTTREEGGRWHRPEVAEFASNPNYLYVEPCLSPKGKRIYFLCTQPPPGQTEKPGWGHQNIWAADRREDGSWSEPYYLGEPVDGDWHAYFPSMTRSGTLYYTRHKPGATGAIYRSHRDETGRFIDAERVTLPVEEGVGLYNACVDADEKLMVACMARPGQPIVYALFSRNAKDEWIGPVILDESINQPGTQAISPGFSPDGKYFFFAQIRMGKHVKSSDPLTMDVILDVDASPQNGRCDIYWVDSQVLYDQLEAWRTQL